MRFVIYGAGGIGATIGARLARAGVTVQLIARGAHLDALRSKGLRFVAPDGDHELHLPVVGHPADLEWRGDDVVFLCMKSQHTLAALEDLRRAVAEECTVVCAQNGVANEREALRRFRRVYAMVVILPAVFVEPGRVVTHAQGVGGILDVGRYPHGVDLQAETIAATLRLAGFESRTDPAVMRQKYAKLLMNLDNALQAATGMRDDVREIHGMLRKEALACYRAAGVDCASADEVKARLAEGPRMVSLPDQPRVGGSSWQSLARATGDIESDYLNGEIVLMGRLHGVPTPANAALQRIGHEMAKARQQPGSLSVAEIVTRIEREAQAGLS